MLSKAQNIIRKTTKTSSKMALFVLVTLIATAQLLVFSIRSAEAAPALNYLINYQGKLLDSSGAPVPDGTYDIDFRLYDSNPSEIWAESDSVTVTDGLFSVMLGQNTSLEFVDFNQSGITLGIDVEGDGEMTPRKEIGMVPAAFVADTVDGISSGQFLRNDVTNIASISDSSTFLTITQNGSGKILDLIGTGSSRVFNAGSNGIVNVGTSTGYARFNVWGASDTAGQLANFVNNASTSVLTILNNGNVGVGTTTPEHDLTISDPNGGATLSLFDAVELNEARIINAGGNMSLLFQSPGGSSLIESDGSSYLTYSAPSNQIWYTNGIQAMFLASDGNLNIGDESLPGSLLSVGGNAVIGDTWNGLAGPTNGLLVEGNVSIGEILPVGNKLTISGNAVFGTGYDQTAAPTNGILVEGNVGIGTTSPIAKLAVGGSAYIGGNLTATGTLTVGTLSGLLQATNGVVSTLSSIGVANGGTGATSFGQGWIYSTGGTSALAASTSPTVNYLTATSTSATSTFAYDLSVDGRLRVLQAGTSATIIGDTSGNARGNNALDIQSNHFSASRVASGANSIAVGLSNTASGDEAIALGNSNTVDANGIGLGHSNTTSGFIGIAVGRNNVSGASLGATAAYGYANTASGVVSAAYGMTNNATGPTSSAFGQSNIAGGDTSNAFGYRNFASVLNSVTVGNRNFSGLGGLGAVAMGFMNNQTGATLNLTTAAVTGSATGSATIGKLSSSVGIRNLVSGDYGQAFGFFNNVSVSGGSAFGSYISNSLASSTQIGSGDMSKIVIRGDTGFEGYVGIGTTSPYAKLSVVGETVSSYFTATTTTASTFPYASTTMLSASTICISTDCRSAWPTSGASFGKSWEITNGYLAPTTTIGILVNASSTIGNGNQNGGLTISGGATTTGIAYFGSQVGIGTSSPSALLTIDNNSNGNADMTLFDSTENSALTILNGGGNGIIRYTNSTGIGTSLVETDGATYSSYGAPGANGYLDLISNGLTRLRVAADGNVGIGTTSPYAKLSVIDNSNTAPQFYVGTSTSGSADPLFYVGATSTGVMDWARVAVGTSTMGSAGLRDQFTVAGRIYSTWKYISCDFVASAESSGGTADTVRVCGGNFVLDSDNSDGGLLPNTGSSYPAYGSVRAGANTATANEAGDLRTWNRIASVAQNPVMETMVRNPSIQAGSMYATGWSDRTANSATIVNEPTNGIYFIATSTTNWRAVVKVAGVYTLYADTGIPQSNTFTKMRIEVTPNNAYFLVDNNVVASVSGSANLPATSVYMAPSTLTAVMTTGGTVRLLDLSYVRVWVDDPISMPDQDGPLPVVQIPEYDGAAGANIALQYLADNGSEFPVGSILSLTDDGELKVGLSQKMYDKNIIGVLTNTASSVHGQEDQTSLPVAYVGRIPVRVTAAKGRIEKGDPITSSTIAGVGMKANASGYIIGRALENYSNTEEIGTILVNINPQYFTGSAFAVSEEGVLSAKSFAIHVTNSASVSANGFSSSDYESSLDLINNLELSRYRNINGSTEPGLLSQKVSREILTPSGDIDLVKLSLHTIGAVKVLKLKTDTLETRIAAIEAQIASSTPALSAEGFAKGFEKLGAKISEGFAYFKNLVVDDLTIGSSEKPSGITLFDEKTGEPYCVKISGGKLKSFKGACEENSAVEIESDEVKNTDIINTDGNTDPLPLTENENGTETPKVEEETKTTDNPPVVEQEPDEKSETVQEVKGGAHEESTKDSSGQGDTNSSAGESSDSSEE